MLWHADNLFYWFWCVRLVWILSFKFVRPSWCLNTAHTTAVGYSTPLRSLCPASILTRNAPIQRTRPGQPASVFSATNEPAISVTRCSDRIRCPPPSRLAAVVRLSNRIGDVWARIVEGRRLQKKATRNSSSRPKNFECFSFTQYLDVTVPTI